MEGFMSKIEEINDKLKKAIELLNRTYMTFSELMKLYEDMYNNHLKEDIDKYFKEVAEMQEKQRKENDEDNKQDSL